MKNLITYFIADAEAQVVKIGKSYNPEVRLKQLQTGCARPLSLALLLPVGLEHLGKCASGDWDEKTLHARFSVDRLNGEWFRLSTTIKDFIYRMSVEGA